MGKEVLLIIMLAQLVLIGTVPSKRARVFTRLKGISWHVACVCSGSIV